MLARCTGWIRPKPNNRTDELLELMDLSDDADKLIIDYSQGMKKKTALAAALIHAPRVLFLDEPFEGVDVISKRAILDVLQRLRQSGTTIFFSSHILEVAERLCTSVAVIDDGKLVAEGTIAELRERAQAGDTATGVEATGVEQHLKTYSYALLGLRMASTTKDRSHGWGNAQSPQRALFGLRARLTCGATPAKKGASSGRYSSLRCCCRSRLAWLWRRGWATSICPIRGRFN